PLGGTYMFEKYPKTRLAIALFASSFLLALASAGVATAEGDSGAYLIGQWKLNDIFSDFKPPGSKIVTDNTEFVFLNPTNLTLTLEYAFFAPTARLAAAIVTLSTQMGVFGIPC